MKLRNILWLGLLLGFASSVAMAQTIDSIMDLNQRTRQRLVEADSLAAIGDDEQILIIIPTWLEQDDHVPEVTWPLLQRLGLAEYRLGHLEQAVESLERTALWAPLEPDNHRNLALALMASGHRGRAFAEYREALELAPADWRLQVEFAHVLLDYRQNAQAREVVASAQNTCPLCPDVDRVVARYHLAVDQPDGALAPLERLIVSHPDDDHLRDQLALVLLRTGYPDRARLLLLPDWPQGLSGQGRRIVLEADRALGSPERALELVIQGLDSPDLEPDADFWALAAMICHDAEEDESGLMLMDRAILLRPDDAAYRNNRVAFLFRLGRISEAEAEWSVVLQLDPTLSRNRTDTPGN